MNRIFVARELRIISRMLLAADAEDKIKMNFLNEFREAYASYAVGKLIDKLCFSSEMDELAKGLYEFSDNPQNRLCKLVKRITDYGDKIKISKHPYLKYVDNMTNKFMHLYEELKEDAKDRNDLLLKWYPERFGSLQAKGDCSFFAERKYNKLLKEFKDYFPEYRNFKKGDNPFKINFAA